MISVIIPVYNDARMLARCLASIAQQCDRDIEVIVVDDGSDPPLDRKRIGVPTSLQGYIHWVGHEHAGAAAARNRGATAAHGDFLLFCDADIVFAPGAFASYRAALAAQPNASYAYPAFRFGWKHFSGFPFDAGRLRRMPFIHTTALVRRGHFPGFDPSLARFQDWDLWLTMLEQGHIGVHIPQELFAIRRTRGAMSRWVPSFAFRLPWKLRRVRRYEEAAQRIRAKHHLVPSLSTRVA